MTVEWKCPKCGIGPDGCAKANVKTRDNCKARRGSCSGFICECRDSGDDPEHGESHAKPCPDARCYHCGWSGTYPPPLRNVKKWEREARAAGWTPPPGWEEQIKESAR